MADNGLDGSHPVIGWHLMARATVMMARSGRRIPDSKIMLATSALITLDYFSSPGWMIAAINGPRVPPGFVMEVGLDWMSSWFRLDFCYEDKQAGCASIGSAAKTPRTSSMGRL